MANQTIYEVWLDCVWNCSDDGHDSAEVMGLYTEKELAIKAASDAIEKYLESVLDSDDVKHSKECDEDWKKSVRTSFKKEIENLKNGEVADITLPGHFGFPWGDEQIISIEEHELNKDFTI